MSRLYRSYSSARERDGIVDCSPSEIIRKIPTQPILCASGRKALKRSGLEAGMRKELSCERACYWVSDAPCTNPFQVSERLVVQLIVPSVGHALITELMEPVLSILCQRCGADQSYACAPDIQIGDLFCSGSPFLYVKRKRQYSRIGTVEGIGWNLLRVTRCVDGLTQAR